MFPFLYELYYAYTQSHAVGMLLHDNDILNFKCKPFVTAAKLIGE